MLKEYAVQATVIIYVGGRGADDAADHAWDALIDKGLTPKTVDVLGVT